MYFLGVKLIQAVQKEKDGVPGYEVTYPDGYVSWSPKATFEAAYLPIGDDPTRIHPLSVEQLCEKRVGGKLGEKTTTLLATLPNGFEILATSGCVDPANYSQSLGESSALPRIKDKVWELLGFVLQWGRNGIKPR